MNPFINMTAQKAPDPFMRTDFMQEKAQPDSGFLKMLQNEIRKDEPARQHDSGREPELKAEKETGSPGKSSETLTMKGRPDDKKELTSASPEQKSGSEKAAVKHEDRIQAKADVPPAFRKASPVLKSAPAKQTNKLSVQKTDAPSEKQKAVALQKKESAGLKSDSAEKPAVKTQPVSQKRKAQISAEKETSPVQEQTVPEQLSAAAEKISAGTDAVRNGDKKLFSTKDEISAVDLKQQIPAKTTKKQLSAGRKDVSGQKIQTVPEKKQIPAQAAAPVQEQKKKIPGTKKTDPVHTETAVKAAADKQETDVSSSRISFSADSVTAPDSGTDKSGLAFRFAGNGTGDFKPGQSLQEAANLMKEQPGRFQEQLQELMNGAKLQIKDSRNGSLNINLYPRALGTLTLNLGLEQGILNGRFIVDSQEAKDLLNENMNYIKQQLQESGIELGQFQVDVRDRGNHQHDRSVRQDFQFADIKEERTEDPVSAAYEMNFSGSHDGSVNLII